MNVMKRRRFPLLLTYINDSLLLSFNSSYGFLGKETDGSEEKGGKKISLNEPASSNFIIEFFFCE